MNLDKLKLFGAFVSGSLMMLFVLVVWLQFRFMPQAINYENKLIECQKEIALMMAKNMNVSLRK